MPYVCKCSMLDAPILLRFIQPHATPRQGQRDILRPKKRRFLIMATGKTKSKVSVGKELVLGSLAAELFGTFVLTTVLLKTAGNPFIAALTVIVLVMALNRLSGGHINSAVTIAMWATRQISAIKAGGYVLAQVLGGMLALVVVTQCAHAAPVDPLTGEVASVFAAPELTEQWRPFFGELLGGLVFGVAVAAAVLGRKTSLESGFVVGGGLLLGLVVALLGSSAILNPAVAVGMSAINLGNIWTSIAYIAGPIAGVAAGTWLYKLLQWD